MYLDERSSDGHIVLLERGVPFLFASAYDLASIAPRFAQVPCLDKVYAPERLLQMIVAVCDRAQLSAPE